MRCLVFGGTGFIGRNLVDHLLDSGEEITVATRGTIPHNCEGRVRHFPFNLDSPDNIRLSKIPDCVFNLAWAGLPNYDSAVHLDYNLPAQIILMRTLIRAGCPKIVITGTCFEYGDKSGPLREDVHCEPTNSYGLAKDCLRRVAFKLSEETNTVVIWTRLFYNFGGAQKPNSLLGQLGLAIREADKSFRISSGTLLRDYMDIKDIVNTLHTLAQKVSHSYVVNIGTGMPTTIENLVKKICEERGVNLKLEVGALPNSKFEPEAFWADTTKLRSILNER